MNWINILSRFGKFIGFGYFSDGLFRLNMVNFFSSNDDFLIASSGIDRAGPGFFMP